MNCNKQVEHRREWSVELRTLSVAQCFTLNCQPQNILMKLPKTASTAEVVEVAAVAVRSDKLMNPKRVASAN